MLDLALKTPDTAEPALLKTRFYQDALDLFTHRRAGHMLYQCYVGRGMQLWNDFMRASGDYYVTRNEAALIQAHADDIARIARDGLGGRALVLAEFGPGTEDGIRAKSVPTIRALRADIYVPADWSQDSLDAAKRIAEHEAPGVRILPQALDFNRVALALPPGRRVLVQFGSTLSNVEGLSTAAIPEYTLTACLKNYRGSLSEGDLLVIGYDRNQDGESLEKAYGHPLHAAFSENILTRMAEDLPVSGFRPEAFRYDPRWQPENHLFPHSLVAQADGEFALGRTRINYRKGERFNYSNSWKYPADVFNAAARAARFEPVVAWADHEQRMVLQVLRAV